ncbi:MAG: hypothetical protein HKL80_03740 [Acidimicrobiales bacterium]|nr:hypothetical protein [Acidimicrobiales bacterium]
MPKTLQVRDITDEDYASLRRRAAEAGITVPELVRREIERIAARPSVAEWVARTRRRTSDVTTSMVVDALDEIRGSWPNDRS